MRATLASPLKAGGSRREFLRAQWDGETIFPQAIQDSGVTPSVPQAESDGSADDDAGAPDLQDVAPSKQGPDLILKKALSLPPA